MSDRLAESRRMSLRTLTPGDVAGFGAVLRDVVTAALILMEQEGHAWCVLVDDVQVGFGSMTSGHELMLYLLPAHQRQGYGSTALRSFASHAFAAGAEVVYAKARVGSGGAALALKIGFNQVGATAEEQFFEMRAPK